MIDGNLRDWSDEFLLPDFGAMDDQEPFGRIWLGWDETGLSVACRVEGRSKPFKCDPKQFWKGDNLRLCTDMRDTRDIKRASRYCQQFYLLPSGGGNNGKSPMGGAARIHRATEHAPLPRPGAIEIAGTSKRGVYTMEAHIPADTLAGFDPDEHRRIGIYTVLEDVQLGQQYLTVADDLNWHIDPSTWATGVLVK